MRQRRSTGGIVADTRGKPTRYSLRFRAGGKRHYIALGPVSRAQAEDTLRHILADVERGIWEPPKPAAPEKAFPEDPTFHEFASRWFADNEESWRENTRLDYEWQLSHHLLPFFQNHRLSQITIAEVDRYRAAKLAEARRRSEAIATAQRDLEAATPATYEKLRKKLTAARHLRGLGATSINKTITRLSQILEVAVEYELITSNPAKGRRRRVKAAKPAPVWLDRAEQIEALLAAAAELDAEARRGHRHVRRRAMLAVFVLAGLRISELRMLRWRDIDLSASRISVRWSKTDAGIRQIEILPRLLDELTELKATSSRTSPDDLVFGTAARKTASNPNRSPQPFSPDNIRDRVLAPAVRRASENLVADGEVPLPDGLTPHKLRHTFASILVALGVDPGSVMDQLGHTDPAFSLRIYRHQMRRDETSTAALRALVGLEAPLAGSELGSKTSSRPLRASGIPERTDRFAI